MTTLSLRRQVGDLRPNLSPEQESFRIQRTREYHAEQRKKNRKKCKACDKVMPIPKKNKYGQYRYSLTCSPKCATSLVVASKVGSKNPMKREEVRNQVSATIREKHLEFFSAQMKKTWKDQREHMISASLAASSRKPSGFEHKLTAFLEKHSLPFRYTGDFSFWIGPCASGRRKNPDYISTTKGQKKVILAHGRYWHPDDKLNALEIADYKSKGWDSMIVWDDEPMNAELAQRVMSFAGQKLEKSDTTGLPKPTT